MYVIKKDHCVGKSQYRNAVAYLDLKDLQQVFLPAAIHMCLPSLLEGNGALKVLDDCAGRPVKELVVFEGRVNVISAMQTPRLLCGFKDRPLCNYTCWVFSKNQAICRHVSFVL